LSRKTVKITRDAPHGLRYSLTLHDPIGTRMFRDAHQSLKDFFEEVDRVLKARQEKC
jgi:hypothetical protein